MPRPTAPKPKDLVEVLRIAKALDAEGYGAGSVHVAPDGGWSISWAKQALQAGQVSPLDEWKAKQNAAS